MVAEGEIAMAVVAIVTAIATVVVVAAEVCNNQNM